MKINKLPKEIHSASIKFGLIGEKEKCQFNKITDGVSSDIWHVKTSSSEYCIKRALKKLAVKEDWFAPIDRSNFEANYFTHCKKIIPESFPKILGHDHKNFILAMEWYDNKEFVVWKKNLLNKSISLKDAKRIGRLLGKIHKYYYQKERYKKIFLNDKTFYSIRIEPYLVFTSKFYPELSSCYKSSINFLKKNQTTVIHGDFSPKNILIGKSFPIILDAETACWGNPIFDLAFLNNHLILKSILNKDIYKGYVSLSKSFLKTYLATFPTINNDNYIREFVKLQALLLLARVDGKSPVEYFLKNHKVMTRKLAKKIIFGETYNLNNFYTIWENVIRS